ncbi:hypothetical protein [Amycolatopsis taiwanensis]|uniref:Uncharacterized protein n=1 Tax=Amycolatopsis taiwanensis TaxID=342230 RepID=A0A9W6QY37_9PSEU|nr:hypothetical protein [Amycolatopsis taiwanensis]GLY64172.1 hypothetical protein Atai01_07910 [Amycolatopsis taiwanensis]
MSDGQILMHFDSVQGQIEAMGTNVGLDTGAFTDVYQHAKDAHASFFTGADGESMEARLGQHNKTAAEYNDQVTALRGATVDALDRSRDCVQSCAAMWHA